MFSKKTIEPVAAFSMRASRLRRSVSLAGICPSLFSLELSVHGTPPATSRCACLGVQEASAAAEVAPSGAVSASTSSAFVPRPSAKRYMSVMVLHRWRSRASRSEALTRKGLTMRPAWCSEVDSMDTGSTPPNSSTSSRWRGSGQRGGSARTACAHIQQSRSRRHAGTLALVAARTSAPAVVSGFTFAHAGHTPPPHCAHVNSQKRGPRAFACRLLW